MYAILREGRRASNKSGCRRDTTARCATLATYRYCESTCRTYRSRTSSFAVVLPAFAASMLHDRMTRSALLSHAEEFNFQLPRDRSSRRRKEAQEERRRGSESVTSLAWRISLADTVIVPRVRGQPEGRFPVTSRSTTVSHTWNDAIRSTSSMEEPPSLHDTISLPTKNAYLLQRNEME